MKPEEVQAELKAILRPVLTVHVQMILDNIERQQRLLVLPFNRGASLDEIELMMPGILSRLHRENPSNDSRTLQLELLLEIITELRKEKTT